MEVEAFWAMVVDTKVEGIRVRLRR
jgi:hypothetical protein